MACEKFTLTCLPQKRFEGQPVKQLNLICGMFNAICV